MHMELDFTDLTLEKTIRQKEVFRAQSQQLSTPTGEAPMEEVTATTISTTTQ